jgi:CheY-like chemotaxis protein
MALRILLVEDNTHIRESIDLLLQGEGREVVSCGCAEDALVAFGRQPFDVLVTDISLPAMSGIDLARRVLETYPGTWVILSSGYALDSGLDKLGNQVRSLPKPFELEAMDALLSEIRSRLPRP